LRNVWRPRTPMMDVVIAVSRGAQISSAFGPGGGQVEVALWVVAQVVTNTGGVFGKVHGSLVLKSGRLHLGECWLARPLRPE
jgi:hypothetical protein